MLINPELKRNMIRIMMEDFKCLMRLIRVMMNLEMKRIQMTVDKEQCTLRNKKVHIITIGILMAVMILKIITLK